MSHSVRPYRSITFASYFLVIRRVYVLIVQDNNCIFLTKIIVMSLMSSVLPDEMYTRCTIQKIIRYFLFW